MKTFWYCVVVIALIGFSIWMTKTIVDADIPTWLKVMLLR